MEIEKYSIIEITAEIQILEDKERESFEAAITINHLMQEQARLLAHVPEMAKIKLEEKKRVVVRCAEFLVHLEPGPSPLTLLRPS